MTTTTIALDYDNTYTKEPEFWESFMHLARIHDIKVYIVTLRSLAHDNSSELEYLEDNYTKILWCDGNPKREWVKSKYGIDIDIWIDDSPECIYYGSPLDTDELNKWRLEQKLAT